jgi:hypothetical protein
VRRNFKGLLLVPKGLAGIIRLQSHRQEASASASASIDWHVGFRLIRALAPKKIIHFVFPGCLMENLRLSVHVTQSKWIFVAELIFFIISIKYNNFSRLIMHRCRKCKETRRNCIYSCFNAVGLDGLYFPFTEIPNLFTRKFNSCAYCSVSQ